MKECCWVAVGHDGFVDLFIWGQSHHIIADVVTGHVNVPHVLILLLGRQLEGIFASQGFFLRPVFAIVAKTRTCCSHIQQSLNCICAFYGKEHEASYGARRLSGKVGNDRT